MTTPQGAFRQVPSDEDDKEWEMVEYEETEEGRAPKSVASGHFDIKIGTKRWNKTLYSADWSYKTYEIERTQVDGSTKTEDKDTISSMQ